MPKDENPEKGAPERRVIKAQMFKGMESPAVDLKDGDDLWIRLPPEGEPEVAEEVRRFDDKIGISLKSLRIDLHNQSFGMVSASTGCISNPGGPGC